MPYQLINPLDTILVDNFREDEAPRTSGMITSYVSSMRLG